MRTRTISAVVVVAVVVVLAIVGHALWAIAVAVGTVIGTAEAYGFARARGQRPDTAVGYSLAFGLVLSALFPEPFGLQLVLACGVVAAFVRQLARPADDRSDADWVATLAYPIAIGVLARYLVLVRALPDGLAWTVVLLVLVWANDTGAYFGGRAWGHTPFFPSLSPKKTREGALAGAVGSVVAGLVLPALGALGPAAIAPLGDLSPIALAVVGLAVAVAGPAGDLSMSFLKRQAGVKDAGDLIPGHGGILDRIDSWLFAAPVVYYAALLLGAAGT